MGLRLFFFPNFPGAMLIQGATFIPDSRVLSSLEFLGNKSAYFCWIRFTVSLHLEFDLPKNEQKAFSEN